MGFLEVLDGWGGRVGRRSGLYPNLIVSLVLGIKTDGRKDVKGRACRDFQAWWREPKPRTGEGSEFRMTEHAVVTFSWASSVLFPCLQYTLARTQTTNFTIQSWEAT